MAGHDAILLYIDDRPVFSSLSFALTIEGFHIASGGDEGADPSSARALVIDQAFAGDGLAKLRALRAGGCRGPAILIATHPTRRLRAAVAALGAELVEKPLLGDELTRAIHATCRIRKAA